jgi:hypothetical protein
VYLRFSTKPQIASLIAEPEINKYAVYKDAAASHLLSEAAVTTLL